jgi:RNA polymerase sigma-70 factor, ECF subfamily
MRDTAQHSQSAVRAAPMSAGTFADFYAAYLPQVKTFLARAGCDAHSLDDLAQETFLRAWDARNRFLGTVQFRTWLLGIAKNTARESWRRRRPNTEPLDPHLPQEAPRPAPTDPETARNVRDAVARLPSKQQMAIRLVYLNGFTQSDAASKSNCAHDAFRRRLASGRTNLRRLLKDVQDF